jgi:protein subunit release factor B
MSDGFVSPAKRVELVARMARLGIQENDVTEKFVLGSGRGGQKINKTASCVYLRHVASGIEVKCQATRHRELNRFLARRELCDRLAERQFGLQSARRQEQERIRRQKRRRSRRQKERMLADKRHQAGKKELRRSLRRDDD